MILKSKCDIIAFNWTPYSRDSGILEPVLAYLEISSDFSIIRSNFRAYLFKILFYRPKMIILANWDGAPENANVARLAYNMGIKVVSLMSEGLFFVGEDKIVDYFFEFNKKRECYVDAWILWSNYYKEIFTNRGINFPMYVSGATGFDRYRLFSYMTKEELLVKLGRHEERIILLIGYGFDGYKTTSDEYDDFSTKMDEFKKYVIYMYDQVIKATPDTLFVLKYHPSSKEHKEATEFAGLNLNVNTIEIVDEIPFSDLLSACDFSICVDSTSQIEAWMLGKNTVVVRPADFEINLSDISRGSVCVNTCEKLLDLINEYYTTGQLMGFNELSKTREDIITKIIGWSDGDNYKRCADIINCKFSAEKERKVSLSIRSFICEAFEEIKIELIMLISPSIYKSSRIYREIYRRYDSRLVKREKEEYEMVVRKKINTI